VAVAVELVQLEETLLLPEVLSVVLVQLLQ
jgi:hypothetical protein